MVERVKVAKRAGSTQAGELYTEVRGRMQIQSHVTRT